MQEVIEFVYQLLRERVCRIVPNKEEKYLPAASDIANSWGPIADMIYVLERFHSLHVPPLRYKLVESSFYCEMNLSEEVLKRLMQLKTMLWQGKNDVNNPSFNYLPPSAKSYFRNLYGSDSTKRYNTDFITQFFGIRHFHLGQRQEDILLYYVVLDDTTYLLKIGKHLDLYKQDMVEMLVNEFPAIIHRLGIMAMPDMPVGEHSYTEEEVKYSWQMGGNVSYVINGCYYTSSNIQALTNISSKTLQITQNILYQIKYSLGRISEYLRTEHSYIDKHISLVPLIYNSEENIVEIGCPAIMEAFEIKIDYLKILKVTDDLLG